MNKQLILPRSIRRAYTKDGLMTYDQATIDSSGAFVIGELERLDQRLHMPLASVTWGRDIDLRSDVSIADETSSFTNSSFAAPGGVSPNGKSWIGKDATTLATIQLDIGKTANPLTLWAMQIGWTIVELASAQQIGRPIDTQKFAGMNLKHQMDTDEQVFIGDTSLGVTGMVNNVGVTPASAITGNWISGPATPAQILADVNSLLNTCYANSGYSRCPTKLLLPPLQFSWLASQLISSAGNISILEFLRNNSICNAYNGKPLDIQPLKWLLNRGAGNTQRMVAYTQEEDVIRFPMVPLQRTPLEYRGLFQLTTYYGRLGVVEIVYPELVGYVDGI